ncbi:MAG: hypothetical protein K0V04_01245 [Deltaproteobacteria bacterium]|nr:hypothetical protein [Deltaproteobacteria bacterium]
MVQRIHAWMLLATLTACGPSDARLDGLDVTVTTPSGWSVQMMRESSMSRGDAELQKGGKTYGFLSPKVVIPLGADKKAWPKEGPHTQQQLEAAFAPLSPTDVKAFERGFGLRYEKKGKPKFFYVVQLDGRELSCTANDWIAAEDVPAAISICTSVRP